MKKNNQSVGLKCKNCGAPVTTEICPFCGQYTGLDTEYANTEYPVIDCKEANLNFWTIIFPLIFVLSFGSVGVLMPIAATIDNKEEFSLGIVAFVIPFAMVAVGFSVVIIKNILGYVILKLRGKQITATVYGYVDDHVRYNGVPGQVVKLLVSTPDGYRFIMYQLKNTTHPYGINSKVNLLVYKDFFMIEKTKREYIKW